MPELHTARPGEQCHRVWCVQCCQGWKKFVYGEENAN